jgi:hypothetical protein
LIGWISLGVSFVSLMLSLAVSAQLAQAVFQIASHMRSLVFVTAWVGASLGFLAAVWTLIYGLLGGATS